MTDAFSAAIDVFFADDNFSATATYTPAGGSPVTVRVLKRILPTIDFGGGGRSQAAIPVEIFGIRLSEVADEPPPGSTLQVGAVSYVIESAKISARRAYWACDAREGP